MVAVGFFVVVGLLVAQAVFGWRERQQLLAEGRTDHEARRAMRLAWLKMAGSVLGVVAAVGFVVFYNDHKREDCAAAGLRHETGIFVRCVE